MYKIDNLTCNMDSNKFRLYLCVGLAAMLMAVIVFQVYQVIDARDKHTLVKDENYRREIETPAKKLLNGYLGPLFRFKYMGNLNWLAIPLVFWFLFSKGGPTRPRWQQALAFVWLLSLIFVGAKGYYNSRYQLTLFPFTLFIVLTLTWELLKDKKTAIKVACFAVLFLFAGYNTARYFSSYKLFWELRVSRSKPHFPTKIVDFLNSQPDIGIKNSRVFVYNQPMYYYHTDKPGIDYITPYRHEIYLHLYRTKGDRRKIHRYIRKKSKVKYILIGWATENELRDRNISEFVNCEARMLFNEHGYRLYEIRDILLEQELKKPGYQKIPQVRSSDALSQGKRGEFNIEKLKAKGLLKITNRAADQKGRRLLQFGFQSGEESGIQVPAGKYVHVLLDARLSKSLLNRNNYIFIQDYKDKKWRRDRIYFSTGLWRTYRLSRKIREGSSQYIIGIRFVPKNSKEQLLIKNIRAYISDNPL